jgi:hypothetical protein
MSGTDTGTDVTTEPTAPRAERFATYKGDRTNMLNGIYGPNEFNELMCVADVAYDPEADTSRVGFAYATLPQLKAALASGGAIEISDTAFTSVATAMAYAKAVAA